MSIKSESERSNELFFHDERSNFGYHKNVYHETSILNADDPTSFGPNIGFYYRKRTQFAGVHGLSEHFNLSFV